MSTDNESPHYENNHRTLELRDTPEHAHLSAEQQRGKQDHLTAAELSRRAFEHHEDVLHPSGGVTTGHGVAAFGHAETAALAHTLWVARGCPLGSPEQDWFQAVKELRSRATGQDAGRD